MFDDFDAYLEKMPSIDDLMELANRHKLEPVLKQEIGQLRFLKADRKRDFRCYIPVLTVEQEDIPQITNLATEKIRYLLNFDACCSNRSVKYAKELVRKFGGFLYNEESAELIYPRKLFGRHETLQLHPTTADVVTLCWFFLEKLPDEKIQKFLDLIAERASFCLPIRFGCSEPLQGNFKRDGTKQFIDVCKRDRESFGFTTWTTKSPCITGSIAIPKKGQHYAALKDDRLCSTIELDFDLNELDESWNANELAELLTVVASTLDAHYAGALLNRGVERRGGNVYFSPHCFDSSTNWRGIPDRKTWLTWFGPELKQQLADVLKDWRLEHDGQFLRMGEQPLSPEEIGNAFPHIPDRLVDLDNSLGPFILRGRSKQSGE